MSYTALYRKWRPATFEGVKGQDHIVQTLKNQISSQRIGHAYLFCGTRGTGKTSVAKIFAKAVNCQNPVDANPCGTCQTCQNIGSGRSLNVVEIDAASNNGVENIREIRDQVQYPPTEGKYRVYIIDEVHMLSTGAFNALLKTLEEPPPYVIFILATTEVHKIPVTVLSRCQRYDFKRISVEAISSWMEELARAEGIQVEEKALKYIAKSADGAMRDALSLLDQCAAFHYGEALTYEHVLDVLGAVDITVFSRLFRAVAGNQARDCIYCLEELVVQGRELGQFVIDFIWYMRSLLILKTVEDGESMLDMSAENLALIQEEAGMVENETLVRYIRTFSDLSNQLRYASQKRVLIEVALIKLTKPEMEQSLEAVLERVGRIERQLEEGVQIRGGLAIPGSQAPGSPNAHGDTAAPGGANAPDGMMAQGSPNASWDGPEAPSKVALPKGQLEDLEAIRNQWGKIVRGLGGAIRASYRDTVVEPSGESCLCVVFGDPNNYQIGSRPTVLGEIERYVEENYQKSIYFKARLKGGGERLDTIYVSDEELKANIHMDITIEEEE